MSGAEKHFFWNANNSEHVEFHIIGGNEQVEIGYFADGALGNMHFIVMVIIICLQDYYISGLKIQWIHGWFGVV